MTGAISETLENCLISHLNNKEIFSNQKNLEIYTSANMHYILINTRNSTVIMNGRACKRLDIINCRNITIISNRMPILGAIINKSDGLNIIIKNEANYLELNKTMRGLIRIECPCVVEIDDCHEILLNNVNVSKNYIDSTWTIDDNL